MLDGQPYAVERLRPKPGEAALRLTSRPDPRSGLQFDARGRSLRTLDLRLAVSPLQPVVLDTTIDLPARAAAVSLRLTAERLVQAGLEDLGWTEAELSARRRGEGAKLELAGKLRAATTMTLRWIAARLQMGTGSSLSNLLSARRRGKR